MERKRNIGLIIFVELILLDLLVTWIVLDKVEKGNRNYYFQHVLWEAGDVNTQIDIFRAHVDTLSRMNSVKEALITNGKARSDIISKALTTLKTIVLSEQAFQSNHTARIA